MHEYMCCVGGGNFPGLYKHMVLRKNQIIMVTFLNRGFLLILGFSFVLFFIPIAGGAGEIISTDSTTTKPVSLFSENRSYILWMQSMQRADSLKSPVKKEEAGYQDLSLRQCLDIAFYNNFFIKNSRRDLLISESNLREAEAEFLPFVNLGAGANIGKDRTRLDGDMEETHSNSQQGSVSVLQNLSSGARVEAEVSSARDKFSDRNFSNEAKLAFTQPLLRGGGIKRGLANLRLSQLSLLNREIEDALAIRDTLLGVIEQYYIILQSKRQLDVSLDALEEKRRFLEATKIKFSLDQIPESEISRSEIQYLQERENVVSRKTNYEDQLEKLLIQLGLSLDKQLSVKDVTQSLFQVEDIVIPPLEQCLQAAMAHRLELLQSEIIIRQQRIALDKTKNDLLPDLDLSLEYATRDSDEEFEDSTSMRDENVWDANLSLSIPLPNIARKEAYKRARISLEKKLTDRKSRERNIIREVKQSYRRLKSSESSLLILKRTVEQAKKSLEQERGRFDVGLSTSNDVTNAQDDLFETQSQYFFELLEYQINIARLYKAMGLDLY